MDPIVVLLICLVLLSALGLVFMWLWRGESRSPGQRRNCPECTEVHIENVFLRRALAKQGWELVWTDGRGGKVRRVVRVSDYDPHQPDLDSVAEAVQLAPPTAALGNQTQAAETGAKSPATQANVSHECNGDAKAHAPNGQTKARPGEADAKEVKP